MGDTDSARPFGNEKLLVLREYVEDMFRVDPVVLAARRACAREVNPEMGAELEACLDDVAAHAPVLVDFVKLLRVFALFFSLLQDERGRQRLAGLRVDDLQLRVLGEEDCLHEVKHKLFAALLLVDAQLPNPVLAEQLLAQLHVLDDRKERVRIPDRACRWLLHLEFLRGVAALNLFLPLALVACRPPHYQPPVAPVAVGAVFYQQPVVGLGEE